MSNQFKLRDSVRIHSFGVDKDGNLSEYEGSTGTILGVSASFPNVNFYMVLLDKPTETYLAINVIDSCLEHM